MSWLRTTGLRAALALGLAFALWVFVAYTQNPEQQAQFGDRPINIEGLSPGLIVVDTDSMPRTTLPNVTINAEADEQTLNALRPGDLRAYIDLSGREAGEHSVRVNVAPTRNGLRTSTVPDVVSIRLEQVITQTVPLTIEVSGRVPFSYEQRSAEATFAGQPATSVQVGGAEGRVRRVDHVRATANVEQLTGNYSSPRPLEAVSKEGQIITGVTIAPSTVQVLVPIVSSAGVKRVPVVPNVVGNPASGYFIAAVSVDPQFVTLTGNSGSLESIQSVATEPFNIRGASSSISQTVDLVRPPGAILQTGEPETAIVTVDIRLINQPFVVTLPIPLTTANAPEGTIVSFNPQVIQVQLEGDAGQLATIQASALQGSINLRGRGVGTYTLEPELTLPPGIRTRGNVPKVTVTVRLPPSPLPTVTTTPLPTATTPFTPPSGTAGPTSPAGAPTAAATPTPSDTGPALPETDATTAPPAATDAPAPTAGGGSEPPTAVATPTQ